MVVKVVVGVAVAAVALVGLWLLVVYFALGNDAGANALGSWG